MRKGAALDVVTWVVVAVALVLGGTTLYDRFTLNGRTTTSGNRLLSEQADWRSYASEGRSWGGATPRVTLVVFSDFQCPFCRRFDIAMDSLAERYPSDLKVVFRHAPLRSHPHAMTAAIAAECAAISGRFHEMRRTLFRRQREIGVQSWSEFAKEAGIDDVPAFVKCLTAEPVPSSIIADTAAMRLLNLIGTPTALVNNTRIDGNVPLATLDSLVQVALGRAK